MKNKKLALITIFIISNIFAINTNAEPKFNTQNNPELFEPDNFESFNRSVYSINNKIQVVIDPIAKTYNEYVPRPIDVALTNFISNIREPVSTVNYLLQGKIEKSLESLFGFVVNTVIGLGGILDIATEMGIKHGDEDLGQTLYSWGVWDKSTFLVLPIFGPTTVRNFTGSLVDSSITLPVDQYITNEEGSKATGLFIGRNFINYTKLVNLQFQLSQQADPYIFMRESYLQSRKSKIYDGNPPLVNLDDFDF